MLKKILPHVSIILSGMYIVFFIIDMFNNAMAFIDNTGTKIIMLALSIVSITVSCMFIVLCDRVGKHKKNR